MKQHTRTEYSMLNIAAGVGGYALSVILSLVNRVIFTRYLPEAYLGISGLLNNVLGMLSLAELGVSGAFCHALYKPLAEKNEEKIASLMKAFAFAYRIVGTVMLTAGILVLPFLKLIIGETPEVKENIYWIYFIFLFGSASSYFFTYRGTLLFADQKSYIETGLKYAVLCVQSVVQIGVLVLTHNYMIYLITQLCFSLINYMGISIIAGKQYPYITGKNISPLAPGDRKRIFGDMRDLMFYKVSGVLVNSTDNIIITYFGGLITTGIASNYTLLVNTLNTLLNQIFGGITASIGNLNAIESDEKKHTMLNVTNLLNFWLFGWATLGFVFVSNDLIRFLFGQNYLLDTKIVLIMAVNFFTVGMQNAIWTFKHTMGLFRYGRFLQLGTAAINLTLSIVLGNIWGLFGIFFATFLSRLFTNLWYDPYVVYKHAFGKKILPYVKKYIVYVAVMAANIAVSYLLTRHLHFVPIVNFFVKGILVSGVFNMIFFFAFRKAEEFSYIVQIIRKVKAIISKNILRFKRS